MPIKQELAANLTGQWQIGLFESPCKAPADFCLGFLCCGCTCVKTALQRNELLEFIGEPYVCCGGIFPCGPLGNPQDPNCVWCEACCCTGCAISGTRFLMQTRFDLQNTCFDDCILWVTYLISWIVCILRMFVDIPDEIEAMVDLLIQIVNGCMIAQQQTELNYQKSKGYNGIPANIMGAVLNPKQQEMAHKAQVPESSRKGAMVGVATVLGGSAGGAIAANHVTK